MFVPSWIRFQNRNMVLGTSNKFGLPSFVIHGMVMPLPKHPRAKSRSDIAKPKRNRVGLPLRGPKVLSIQFKAMSSMLFPQVMGNKSALQQSLGVAMPHS